MNPKKIKSKMAYYEALAYQAGERDEYHEMHYNFQIADHYKRVLQGAKNGESARLYGRVQT